MQPLYYNTIPQNLSLESIQNPKSPGDLFGQLGGLKTLNLMPNQTYGFFEYEKNVNIDFVISCLNGFVVEDKALKITRLGATVQHGGAEVQQSRINTSGSQLPQVDTITRKIKADPVLALQVAKGREVGSRASCIVQIINAVYEEDLLDPDECEEIRREVYAEAKEYGVITEILIPRPNPTDGVEVEGVGKIFIRFQDITSARKFQVETNGRLFDGRSVCAAFYPPDRFEQGRYTLNA
jgi:splicing factor U2AF 65 kDa subunit